MQALRRHPQPVRDLNNPVPGLHRQHGPVPQFHPRHDDQRYAASRAHSHLTGQEDSLYDALAARGHISRSIPAPTDSTWDFDNLTEIQRRLPRLAGLFPRQRYLKT